MSERKDLSKIDQHETHEIQTEKEPQSAQIKISASFESFEGPLPPPEVLNAYPESTRNMIIAECERNSAHRREMEDKIADAVIWSSKWGMILGVPMIIISIGIAAGLGAWIGGWEGTSAFASALVFFGYLGKIGSRIYEESESSDQADEEE